MKNRDKPLVTSSMVRDVKPVALPAAAKAGHLTAKVRAPAVLPPRLASVAVARKPSPALPPRAISVIAPSLPRQAPSVKSLSRASRVSPAALALPRRSSSLAPRASSLPAPVSPRLPSPSPALKTTALHEAAKSRPHSASPRDAGLPTCKERPKSRKPSGSGSGGRSFIPWCR